MHAEFDHEYPGGTAPIRSDVQAVPAEVAQFPPHLPVELLIIILMELDVNDVLMCRGVARSFNDAISTSPQIQYRVELAMAGYLNTDILSPLTTAQKLARLRSLQTNWDSLTHSAKTFIPIPEVETYAFHGGCFAWANKGQIFLNGADTIPLDPPAVTLGPIDLPSRLWSDQHLYRETRMGIEDDFIGWGMDVDQDLLIMFRAMEEEAHHDGGDLSSLYRIVFHTLSTSMDHPEAKYPYINYEVAQPLGDLPLLKVLEDKVAILIGGALRVWNWKSGLVIGTISARVDTFTFFDVDCIAFVNCSIGWASLVSLRDPGVAEQDQSGCRLLVGLQLPPVRHDKAPCAANFLSGQMSRFPCSDSLRPNGANRSANLPAFRADPSVHIVSFEVDYQDCAIATDPDPESDIQWSLCVMIHSSTLRGYVRKWWEEQDRTTESSDSSEYPPPLLVPWSEWAPYARCFINTLDETDSKLQEHVRYSITESFYLCVKGLRAALFTSNPLTSMAPIGQSNESSPQASEQDQTSESPTEDLRIRVLDFHLAPIKRALGCSESTQDHGTFDGIGSALASPFAHAFTCPSRQTLVVAPDHIECPELFEEPIVCGSELPFRYVTLEETIPNVNGLLLDGERIIGSVPEGPEAGIIVLTM